MARLTVGVLGQLEVAVDGRTVRLTTGRLRALLAVLAMSAGQTVSMQRLTAAVWGDAPPRNPTRSLQTYATRLRAELGERAVIGTSGGLVLETAADLVDALRFERLVEEASRQTTPDTERRVLDEALGLWRGEPFEGVESRWLEESIAPRLSELRLSALERRIDLDLAAGRLGELVGELNEWTARYPLRESLWARLLLVLDRSGRRADALDRYHQIRLHIADELGVDPSPELQQIYADLLADHPPAQPATSVDVPRQLPARPPGFVGRTAELNQFDAVDDGPAIVITAIDGMAGVGKTALAVHLAHQVAGRYPDGQLFLDLHGFTEGIEPVDPSDALDGVLRSLGVPGEQIPPQLDARAAVYRSRLADKRVLILLDNAATEAQVAPLIPGTPHGLVLVTSRRRLSGLDRARSVSLDVLPLADALRMFETTAGTDRVAGEPPELVNEIVELCGRLPLALRIAAARLRMHRTWTVRHLRDLLADHQRRLGELDLGERSVVGALELSYQQLTAPQQRAYRLIGLHPGPDLDLHASTALLGGDLRSTRRMLEELISAHLLQEPVPDRYLFHDLTRHHAASVAARDEPADTRRSALEALFTYYLHTAAVATDVGYPFEHERRPRPASDDHPVPPLPTPEHATAWLDVELPNLLAVARHAAENGWPDHPHQLAAILGRHLMSRSRTTDAETFHTLALRAARTAENPVAETNALVCLGAIHRHVGQHSQAEASYQQALRLARDHGHRPGELDALNGLGQIQRLRCQFDEATGSFGQALDIAGTIGYPAGETQALIGIGNVYRECGQHELASKFLGKGLTLARDHGHRVYEMGALIGLGWTRLARNDLVQATHDFDLALDLARDGGHRTGELTSLLGLGDVLRKQHRYEAAAGIYEDVLTRARQVGKPNWAFEALHGLGRTWLSLDRPDDALANHRQALGIAEEMAQPSDVARAHDGLAYAHRAREEHDQARRHWQLALDIFTELGIDGTSEDWVASATAIRGHLAAYED